MRAFLYPAVASNEALILLVESASCNLLVRHLLCWGVGFSVRGCFSCFLAPVLAKEGLGLAEEEPEQVLVLDSLAVESLGMVPVRHDPPTS